jgi:hypothetical protein
VGDTVRRPPRENSQLVRTLLRQLGERGFDGAPRYLGRDGRGREMFTFLPGEVPPDLDPRIADSTLAAAARLIRRFHDATAGSLAAEGHEVVCHNDLSPCNFVFRAGAPAGIIDFDAAAPGERLQDVGIALFLWLNLGADGRPPTEQARRIDLFCHAYGTEPNEDVINAVLAAVSANVEQLRADERSSDVVWWQKQLDWLEQHRADLTAIKSA